MTSTAAVDRPEYESNVIPPLQRERSRKLQRTPGAGPGRRRDTITIVSTRSIVIKGMTCDHCASTVHAEISKLPGIVDVDVDVAVGTVCLTGDPLPGDTPLREAVQEAGYEYVG